MPSAHFIVGLVFIRVLKCFTEDSRMPLEAVMFIAHTDLLLTRGFMTISLLIPGLVLQYSCDLL